MDESFGFDDYKQAIKFLVKRSAVQEERVTFRKIAEKLQIQSTYLSKLLNEAKAQFNEDQLFGLCRVLHLLPNEIDFLFLLRSFAITEDPTRKTFLRDKINFYRRQDSLSVPIQPFSGSGNTTEFAYLFDPCCIVVHAALFIAEYRKHPRRLCSILGISTDRLTLVLTRIAEMNFIELDAQGNVAKLTEKKMHYGTNHPLMRMHQQVLHTLSQAQLLKISESDKQDVLATFSASPETFSKLSERFQQFLKEVESLVSTSRSTSVYQMQFQLFKWF